MLAICLHRPDSNWIPSRPRRAQHSRIIRSKDEWIGWCRSQASTLRRCLVDIVSTRISEKKIFVLIDVHSTMCGIRDSLPIKEAIESRTDDRIDQWITRNQSREDQDDRYGYKRGFHIPLRRSREREKLGRWHERGATVIVFAADLSAFFLVTLAAGVQVKNKESKKANLTVSPSSRETCI